MNRTHPIWASVTLLILQSTLSAANPPKVLIIYDMEGVSGVTAPVYERFAPTPAYAEGRKSLTADVNAAIRGLKAGGAGAVWVQDGHGSGNSGEPDLLVDQMDRRATFDFRPYPFDPYSTGLDGSIDAIVCIGMHARARTGGFMAHTFTFDVAFNVNGVELTETHIIALSAARWGLPVIMVSGDNVLQEQLAPDFPELEYAVVKIARTLATADAVARVEADRRIESSARKAMESFLAGRFRPYFLPPPYNFKLSFRNAEEARMAASTLGVVADGDLGVRFSSANFVEGYEISKEVIRHGMDPLPLLIRVLKHAPNGDQLLEQWEDLIWQQIDPGKLPGWALPAAPSKKPTRYFGDS